MSSSLRLRRLSVVSSFLAVAVLAVLAFGALVVPSHAQIPLLQDRAGTISFPAGSAGIAISFSLPMLDANYAVAVQQTNTAGYSPTSVCTYFNPLHKTATGFEVQHKRCDDGVPVSLDVGVSLDWIVKAYM